MSDSETSLGSEPVIVIFGAAIRPDGTPSSAMRRRVQVALDFGQHQRTPLYLPTGGVGRYGASESSVMAQLLRRRGVSAERIFPEESGTNTLSSVSAVAHTLRARGHTGPVYVASSAYHLPRCVVLMLLAGLNAWACPARASPASRTLRKRWYWRLREMVALPVDVVLLLWRRLRGRL